MPYVNHSVANSVKRMCENGNGRKCQKVNLRDRYQAALCDLQSTFRTDLQAYVAVCLAKGRVRHQFSHIVI